jgi:sugar phosphate isomerase/epimerase
MKIGLSSYSLHNVTSTGEMSLIESMEWIKDNGGEYYEIVPYGFDITGNDELYAQIMDAAKRLDLPVLQYSVGGNVLKDTEADYQNEVERLKGEVRTAARLGAETMRHDLVAVWDKHYCTPVNFDRHLGRIVEAAKEIAVYAKEHGVITTIENHGIFMNGSDNLIRVAEAVDMENFGLTVDVGNFAVVDEDPEIAVAKCMPYAKMIHFKDFYIRKASYAGRFGDFLHHNAGFGDTLGGNWRRGAIAGSGDINLIAVSEIIKQSGYNGNVTIEFEGLEDCRTGSKIGMAAAKALLAMS